MITVDASALRAKLTALVESLDGVIADSIAMTEQRGLESLMATSQFNDRTGDLRGAFRASGATLFVDAGVASSRPPSARSGRVATPPNTYARFLQFGTQRITPRPFMTDARDVVEDVLPKYLEAFLAAAIGA